METTTRFRSFLAVIVLLVIGALTVPLSPLGAQVDIPDIPDEEVEGTEKKAEPEIPPIPEWTPTDLELLAQFKTGREHLDEKRYSEAKTVFRKLRRPAKTSGGEAAIERCLLEAEGGLLCEKAGKYVEKEQPRKVIALWLKEGEDLEGTFTGAELLVLHEAAMAEVFETLADFEPKKSSEGEEDADAEEEEEEDEGNRPGGQAPGSGYGRNTRLLKGAPEEGEVRFGKGSLHWTTTRNVDAVSFAIPEGVYLDEYRYLRISLRSESRKIQPPLKLILDCEEGNIGTGGGGDTGGGGRGRARRGARAVSSVHRRVGYHQDVDTKSAWRDLRLDLRKFEAVGEPRWSNVRFVRIVHLNQPEAGILIDEVVLEKE